MKYLSCLLLLTLISCSSGDLKKDYDPSLAYTSSGVEQFFLPELPAWSNFSSAGGCFKKSSFHYLNFSKLKENYQLSYLESLELQAQYNERLENYFRASAIKFLKPIEQASFFTNTLEQVRGGVKSLKIPKVDQVAVIWIEAFTDQELKQFMKSSKFDEKYTVLLSSCQSKQSLQQWLVQENFDGIGFGLITAEWLSPFDKEMKPIPGLKIYLQELFGPEIKIEFLNSKNKEMIEFILP